MPRSYVSRLRQEQAEATRRRVVEAVGVVLGRDPSEFTFPNVAAEAGVSVATVERLYPTKRDLVHGLARHYFETIGTYLEGAARPPADVEELLTGLSGVLRRTASLPPGLRAAVSSEAFRQYRRDRRAERLKPVEEALKPYRAALSEGEFRHLCDLIAVLGSSAGLSALTDLTGATTEDAITTIIWGIRRLLGRDEPRTRRSSSRARQS